MSYLQDLIKKYGKSEKEINKLIEVEKKEIARTDKFKK